MQQNKKVMKCLPVLLGILLICAVVFLAVICYRNFVKKNDWAKRYAENLKYNFDDSAVNMIIKKKEWDKLSADVFDGFYDFDRDGQAERIQVSFLEEESARTACIVLDGTTALHIALEPGDVQRVFTIVGIDDGAGTYLAVLESVYNGKTGVGKLQWKLFAYQDGAFVQEEDFLYKGMADERGIMKEGVIESRSEGRTFFYDVSQNQNDYIYYRSVVFADMKELGISLPFETVGTFETAYKRNIRGIFSVIVK